jgi:hypothetical protein
LPPSTQRRRDPESLAVGVIAGCALFFIASMLFLIACLVVKAGLWVIGR